MAIPYQQFQIFKKKKNKKMMKTMGEEPYLKAGGKALECERLGVKPCTSIKAWRSKPIDGGQHSKQTKIEIWEFEKQIVVLYKPHQ